MSKIKRGKNLLGNIELKLKKVEVRFSKRQLNLVLFLDLYVVIGHVSITILLG